MREVSVNTGKGGAQLEVIQITDFHLKESTYRDSVPLLRKLMKLSASADKVILTGDTIHSLSDFSLNMLRKEIWNFNLYCTSFTLIFLFIIEKSNLLKIFI